MLCKGKGKSLLTVVLLFQQIVVYLQKDMKENLSSFYFADVRLLPQEQIALHEQDSWEVSWIVLGSGQRQTGDTTEPIVPGEVVLVPPGIPHCWMFDGRSTDSDGRVANVCMSFTNGLLESIATAFPELAVALVRLREYQQVVRFEGQTLQRLRTLLERMRYETAAQRIPTLLQILLVIAYGEGLQVGNYQKTTHAEQRLERIRTYVVCNAMRDISIADIATHVGMNRAAFCSFFKRETGKTFVTYLNEYRIELACQIMRRTKNSIAEVCYQAGFNSVSYFNRTFKRSRGMSPSEYRQRGHSKSHHEYGEVEIDQSGK